MSTTIQMIGITTAAPYDGVFNCDSKGLREILEEKDPSPLALNSYGVVKVKVGPDNSAYYVGGRDVIEQFVNVLKTDYRVRDNYECQRMAQMMEESLLCNMWWFLINW